MHVQAFFSMGDSRHKAPPPDYPEEEVTDDFVNAVLALLAANRTQNKLSGRRPGDREYRISNYAELAEKIAPDQKNAKSLLIRILGPAKASTKAKKPRVATSRYVGPIRDALGIEAPSTKLLEVRADRFDVLRLIATMTNEQFAPFEEAVADRVKQLDRQPRRK